MAIVSKGSREVLARVEQFECRNITALADDGLWPMVWDRAQGVHVWDVDGKRHVDFTAAFGVANAGHANPFVVKAGQRQMAKLLHAMGDVHPHAPKAALLSRLSNLTFERWNRGTAKSILCNSGSDAIEAALKTAFLATGKPGIIAFHGAYHGLGYGALNATHRDHFRLPFRKQLKEFASFVPYPRGASMVPMEEGRWKKLQLEMAKLIKTENIGAILVEPIQARGGIHVPPGDFLARLSEFAQENNLLLIVDEIFTGFGRTGKWFAVEHGHVVPDLICVGKALTGGFPMSACIGTAELMDRAWPKSTGEAIHTSTFLGHPVGCAMALAQIKEIERIIPSVAGKGRFLLRRLSDIASRHRGLEARGLGLLAGLEIGTDTTPAAAGKKTFQLVKDLLKRGFLFLPEGEHGNVLGFTPPLIVNQSQMTAALEAVEQELSTS